MKTLRINNLDIKFSKNKIFIYDQFKDVSDREAELIAVYLRNEGFIKSKRINIFIKYQKIK